MSKIDSSLATIVRSMAMTVFLLIVGMSMRLWPKIPTLTGRAMIAIVLSGIAGAVSWLFYFKAIQLGSVSKVAPIDKLSMPFAVILAVVLLGDRPSGWNWLGIALIVGGAYLAALPASPAK
jgi:transporter family protein